MPKEEERKLVNLTEEELNANYLHKRVAAADQFDKSRQVLGCCSVMMVMTFLSAAFSKNMYCILLGALSIGWGAVFVVKTLQLRKYLSLTYGVGDKEE